MWLVLCGWCCVVGVVIGEVVGVVRLVVVVRWLERLKLK